MENKDKAMYETPAVEMLELNVERHFCDSDDFEGERESYRPTNPQTWD